MLTRHQLLAKTSAGVAVAAVGAIGLDVAFAADGEAVNGPTLFTSADAPSVSVTVPDGWYVRGAVVQGMEVPWGLAFLSNEHVPWGAAQAGDWDEVVSSNLTNAGIAVSLIAFDRLVPASDWLVPAATRTLRNAGADVGPLEAAGQSLGDGVRFADLRSLDVPGFEEKITPYIAWFDQDHYLVGVEVWLGDEAQEAALTDVLATIGAP